MCYEGVVVLSYRDLVLALMFTAPDKLSAQGRVAYIRVHCQSTLLLPITHQLLGLQAAMYIAVRHIIRFS